jgi:hypothetical protein
MRSALLYILAGLFIALIVSAAWWTREFEGARSESIHVVQSGETAVTIARAYGVPVEALAEANDEPLETFEPVPGDPILVPADEPALSDVAKLHAIGLAAEIAGVFMSFWLGIVAGLMPRDLRRQIFGISLALGIASYAATQATATTAALTPQFVFGAIKDGFMWSAAFPLFARAFGVRDVPRDTGFEAGHPT